MNAEERLAQVVSALEEVGITYLVMGGHAVRYYGVGRNTIDYDLQLSPDHWDDLPDRLSRTRLFAGPPQEGPTWRHGFFRRFLLGRLDDGREEWLEFWRTNHLLPPLPVLFARREEGRYGGRTIPFLGLADLIRSKETEREGDWQDVALLEEIQDDRSLARAADAESVRAALARLRSRRGFEQAQQRGLLGDVVTVAAAFAQADNPMTRGFLVPFLPKEQEIVAEAGLIGEIVTGHLRTVTPGSARHLALVEAIRRLYKQAAREADRGDKMRSAGR